MDAWLRFLYAFQTAQQIKSRNMNNKEEAYEDLPGTWVFDAQRARKGYHLNNFFMSLMKADNRKAFLADESGYLQQFPMSEAQRQAVLARDWNTMLELGGVVYCLAKLAFTDQHSYQFMAAEMTGMSEQEYVNMMLAGGRSPDGWRSKSEHPESGSKTGDAK